MAEVKNDEEEVHTLPSKRKPDLNDDKAENEIENENNDSNKKQKLLIPSADNNSSPVAEEKENNDADEEDEDEEDYDDDDDEEEEDEDSDEHSNGKAEVDRKGKGILREDKGKGKLIEEEEESDDSSDDNGGGGSETDGGISDLSDDPLAEVDLDNILPSRTRRRVAQPGVCISNNLGNKEDNDKNA